MASALFHRFNESLGGTYSEARVIRYSGRGMYGRECIGITGSLSDCMQLIAAVIKQTAHDAVEKALEAGIDGTAEEQGESEAAATEVDVNVDILLGYKQDSMGHDVVLYWPQLAWPEGEVESE
jgi:hypothetical protein